ncbi:unnamed protein product [Boreogadus saida]
MYGAPRGATLRPGHLTGSHIRGARGGAICSVKGHLCASHGEAEAGASLTTPDSDATGNEIMALGPVLGLGFS